MSSSSHILPSRRHTRQKAAHCNIVNVIIVAAAAVAVVGFTLFLVGSEHRGDAHARDALLLHQQDAVKEGTQQPQQQLALLRGLETQETKAKNDLLPLVDAYHALTTITSKVSVKKQRLAYAITITKDGLFQDGAAVLAYSIMEQHRGKKYDVSLVAFVHPNVTTSRPALEKIGFHVIESPTPINSSAIKFKWFREHIDKNGCCGSSELIKLNSYRLLQYDKVIHMDADTFLLNPIDDVLGTGHSVVYTTDPNMASHKGEDKMPYQGGFLVFQPNYTDYTRIVNLLMTVEFRSGSAWNGSKIGWFWGGMTVQGILPFYYNLNTDPGRSVRVDRCYYNTMADTADCLVQSLEEIRSAHFTVCLKPWHCLKPGGFSNSLCEKLHQRWFETRRRAEHFYGLADEPQPCPRGGHKHYKFMRLQDARVPPGVFRPDDSPRILLPVGNSGYRPDAFPAE